MGFVRAYYKENEYEICGIRNEIFYKKNYNVNNFIGMTHDF